MIKSMLIGAVIGGFVTWILNTPIFVGILMGAFTGAATSLFINGNSPQSESEKKMLLQEEELDVQKDRVQTGEIRYHKEIVQGNKTISVPIRREELVIEAGADEEIRIPLKEEEININKYPVQLNEVSITKRQVEELQQVKGKVKKEIALVQTHGDVDIDINNIKDD